MTHDYYLRFIIRFQSYCKCLCFSRSVKIEFQLSYNYECRCLPPLNVDLLNDECASVYSRNYIFGVDAARNHSLSFDLPLCAQEHFDPAHNSTHLCLIQGHHNALFNKMISIAAARNVLSMVTHNLDMIFQTFSCQCLRYFLGIMFSRLLFSLIKIFVSVHTSHPENYVPSV